MRSHLQLKMAMVVFVLPVMARGVWTMISAKSVGLPASASWQCPYSIRVVGDGGVQDIG